MLVPKPLLVLILALIAACGALAVLAILQAEDTQHQAALIERHRREDVAENRMASYAQCQRVQLLRDEVNQSNRTAVVIGENAIAVIESAPAIFQTADVRAHEQAMLRAVRDLRFYPPTDCKQVINNPHYKRPPSVRFKTTIPDHHK